jgi:hypothetical protein
MQFAGQGKPPTGIVYITPMNRPDAALALALLYGLEGKREARAAAVAVSGGSLGAASFCDILLKFYMGSSAFLNSNRVLPVGLSADGNLPPDSPAVKAVLDHPYPYDVKLVSDTSEVRAMIRNALTGQVNGNVVAVLSADPNDLLRTLELPGVLELVRAKIKTLVIVDRPEAAELERAWPTPIVHCPRSVGESLPFPGASIDKDFGWAEKGHPVADFYRASGSMPFDTPGLDLAAILYAVRPDSFQISGKQLTVPAGQQQKIIDTFVELASAKPVPRPGRRNPQAPPAKQEKKTP